MPVTITIIIIIIIIINSVTSKFMTERYPAFLEKNSAQMQALDVSANPMDDRHFLYCLIPH
jgi:hypothetical protein